MAGPKPNGQSVYRPDLRGSVAEEWDANGKSALFVADRVLPIVPVATKSGTYRRIPREEMTKDQDDKRAPDGSFPQSDFSDEEVAFSCKNYGHVVPVDGDRAAQASIYYNAMRVAGSRALYICKAQHEQRVADKLMNTTTFAGRTGAVTVPWSTPATATPIQDVKTARENVRKACGYAANAAVLNATMWKNLTETHQILDRINGGSTTDMPTKALLDNVAMLMDLDEIIVAGGLKDSAKAGQSYSGANMWADAYCLVFYRSGMPDLQELQLGCTPHWDGNGSQPDFTMESWYEEKNLSDMVRARRDVDARVQYTECGYLLSGISA